MPFNLRPGGCHGFDPFKSSGSSKAGCWRRLAGFEAVEKENGSDTL